MANAFVVVDCKSRKIKLTTLSARKAINMLEKGIRIEVWIDNIHFDNIYSRERDKMKPFLLQEKQFIGRKQKKAEERNKRRKSGK